MLFKENIYFLRLNSDKTNDSPKAIWQNTNQNHCDFGETLKEDRIKYRP